MLSYRKGIFICPNQSLPCTAAPILSPLGTEEKEKKNEAFNFMHDDNAAPSTCFYL